VCPAGWCNHAVFGATFALVSLTAKVLSVMGTGNEEAQLQELSTKITEMEVTEDAMQEELLSLQQQQPEPEPEPVWLGVESG